MAVFRSYVAAFDSISEIFDEIIRNSKIKGGNILRITILFLLSDYDESVKSINEIRIDIL